jgi:hypothetical protein
MTTLSITNTATLTEHSVASKVITGTIYNDPSSAAVMEE